MKLRISGKTFPIDLTIEELNTLKDQVLPFYSKYKKIPSQSDDRLVLLSLALVGFITLELKSSQSYASDDLIKDFIEGLFK